MAPPDTPRPQAAPDRAVDDVVIRVRGLRNQFGQQVVHDNLDLDVRRGEVLGVVGGSGTGKSVLLNTIIGLNRPAAGSIEVFGHDVTRLGDRQRKAVMRRWGVLFQDGALFSSLTVGQNIQVPIREFTDLPQHLINETTSVKVGIVGLPRFACAQYPSELSGGKRKRGETYEGCLRREVREETGFKVDVGPFLVTVKHRYSHFSVELHAYHCFFRRGKGGRWVMPGGLNRLAMPRANRKILEALGQSGRPLRLVMV